MTNEFEDDLTAEPIDISNSHFDVELASDDLAKTLPSSVTMPCYRILMDGSHRF
jgi:hypothetical protein